MTVKPLHGMAVSRGVEKNFFFSIRVSRYSVRRILRSLTHHKLQSLRPSSGVLRTLNSVAQGPRGLSLFLRDCFPLWVCLDAQEFGAVCLKGEGSPCSSPETSLKAGGK